MTDRDNEGPFIMRVKKPEGRFECSVCHSMRLRFDFNPYKGQLTLACDQCGNFRSMNFAMGMEVNAGQ